MSDGWRAYRGLEDIGYGHLVINHSKEYVNSRNRNIHTQVCFMHLTINFSLTITLLKGVESMWRQIKRKLPDCGNYSLEFGYVNIITLEISSLLIYFNSHCSLIVHQWFMRCRLEEKSPFWELLRLIGCRYNFDGEADLATVEEAPADTDESDDEDDASEITGLYPTDSEDEDGVIEHKCVVCGKYFESDFLIDKV